MTIHYAHTSHGSQITSGLILLETMDSRYSVEIRKSGSDGTLPPVKYPPALRMYDGSPPETYINPNDYWDRESGLNRTRTGWTWASLIFPYGPDAVKSHPIPWRG